jgi:glycosyltransferase involved in cell wall biosynthesis
MRRGEREGWTQRGLAALSLLASGELHSLGRRIAEVSTGRFLLLPETLTPRPRVAGVRKADLGEAPPSILMVTNSLELEGAPISQFELTLALKREGLARPFVWSEHPGSLAARYRAAGIEVEVACELGVRTVSSWLYERGVRGLAARIAAAGPDIVFVNTVDRFAVVDAAHMAGIRSVWNIREGEPWRERLAGRSLKVVRRALACFSYPERVVFVSEASRRNWTSFEATGNFAVIPNALAAPMARLTKLEARRQLGLPVDRKIILSVGTLCPRKGQLDLVSALAGIDASDPVTLVFVGIDHDGYGEAMLRACAAPLRPHVVVAGVQPNTDCYYAAADIFVCSSRSEASPRTLLEAASAGLPIVTTAVGDIGQRFEHGRSTLMYEPGDSAALAKNLSWLLKNETEAKDIGRRASRLSETETAFSQMVENYSHALGLTALPREVQLAS